MCNVPHRELKGHVGEAYAVAYSPNDKELVTGGQDGTVRIWEVATGNMLAVLKEHTSCVNSIDFAPDGDTFVTASCDKTIKLWSLSRRLVTRTLTDHTLEVDSCQFVDGGKLLISVSRGTPESKGPLLKEVRVHDAAIGEIRSGWPGPSEKYWWFACHRSGNTLVSNTQGMATVWKREGDAWKAMNRFGVARPWGAFISPDEEYLLVPSWPRHVETFRLADGAIVSTLDGRGGPVSNICFSPSGKLFATCAESLRIWEYPSGIAKCSFCGPSGVWAAAWSRSEETIATVASDGIVRIWDVRRGKPNVYLSASDLNGDTANGFAYLRDGVHVNAAYSLGSVTWDMATGKKVDEKDSSEPPLTTAPMREGQTHAEISTRFAGLPQWDPAPPCWGSFD